MNVGELFVTLGVKGTDKTLNAVTGVQKGLKGVASTSLETKAALLGAMYALERLFATSNKTGTDLTNFNTLLGVSAKTLQQYQYAARQVGVSNEEVEGSFKSLQSQMTKVLLGEGMPKSMGLFAQRMGLSVDDIKRFADKPQELIQKLQQYAAKEKNIPLANEVLKSFGLGDNMIAALRRGAFSSQALAKAPTYSDAEIKQLDRANAAWSNLATKIEMAFGHFNAMHGGTLVKDISLIADKVMALASAFQVLAEKTHFFSYLGDVFKGWEIILKGLADLVDSITKKETPGAKELPLGQGEGVKDQIFNLFKGIGESLGIGEGTNYGIPKLAPTGPAPTVVPSQKSVVPTAPPPRNGADNSTPAQSVTVNQSLNFQHDGKDAQKTGDSVKRAVQSAYRQYGAQGQGT